MTAQADVRRWTVPGCVALLGEHLDHVGGRGLSIATDRFLGVKARGRDDHTVNVWSAGRRASFPTSADPEQVDDWAAHVAGAVAAYVAAGHRTTGLDLVLEPSPGPVVGAGPTSASVTTGVLTALAGLAGSTLDPVTTSLLAQRAQEHVGGAPTGLLDPLVVTHGRVGHAVLVHPTTDPPTIEPVPFDPGAAGLALLTIETGVDHSSAVGGHAPRREECAAAAAAIGVDHLVDVRLDQLVTMDDPTLAARARHVFTEGARVKAAVRALRDGDWAQLGTILTASHASLREDFQVSCDELDVATEAALEAGALGARMSGRGFGGSAIALVPTERVGAVAELVAQRFDAARWAAPTVDAVEPSDGATLVA